MTGVRSTLGAGAEFDLIRRFLEAESGDALAPEVMVGPGDDAAVLSDGWVISSDLSVEEVHFRRAWLTDEEIGYRAAAAAVSDMAAMAATPVGFLLSCAAPRDGSVDLAALNRGVRAVATTVGATVIGGDVSRSPGPLFLDVTVLGRSTWPIQRSGAEAGDHVWVTGALGAAAGAVRAWRDGRDPETELRASFVQPPLRVAAARCLAEHEIVDAMIDLSDGLVGDVGHIAAASGVSITIEEDRVPCSAAVRDRLGQATALDLALRGGEDYELCFVTDPGAVDVEYFRKRFDLEITRIGFVDEGAGVWLQDGSGVRTEATTGGYDHWSDSNEDLNDTC